jgi:hypothetical protein
MINFASFRGRVTRINDFVTSDNEIQGCIKFISVENRNGDKVGFLVSPNTYIVDQAIIHVGDIVTGYYDANAPVPLIYPPQYHALVMVKENRYRLVKVDYFDENLVSSDGQLKINPSPVTRILLTNGQPFNGSLENRNLIVIYSISTRSIPAITTPIKIIVLCY